MTEDTYEVLEFHLSRELPNAGAFVLTLLGAGFVFFSTVSAPELSPFILLGLSMVCFFLAAIFFTFRSVVRMDNRRGTIEKTISTFVWKKYRKYAVAEFTGVGIGMGGGSNSANVTSSGRYFVQLLGRTIVNIPGSSSNKGAIIELAERVGGYLNLPVDKKPLVAFFQKRWDWSGR